MLTDNISHVDPASSVFFMNEAMVMITIKCSGGADTVLLVSTGVYVNAYRVIPRVRVN
jgi:hypothetical protein